MKSQEKKVFSFFYQKFRQIWRARVKLELEKNGPRKSKIVKTVVQTDGTGVRSVAL